MDKRKWLQLSVYVVSLVGSLVLDLTAPNVKSLLCSPIDLEKVNKVLAPDFAAIGNNHSSPDPVAMVGLAGATNRLNIYGWGDYPVTGAAAYA